MINYLRKDAGKSREAKLSYEVVRSNNKYSLLEIKPETGRFHQIRAQLSLAGFPIVGDTKYGYKESLPDRSIALCATSLSFKLVTKNEIKKLSIPIPRNIKWPAE